MNKIFINDQTVEDFLFEAITIRSYFIENRLKKELFNNNTTESDKLFTFNSGDLSKLTDDESNFNDFNEYFKGFYKSIRDKSFCYLLGNDSFFTLVLRRLLICKITENPYILAFKEILISYLIKNFNKYVYE